MNEKQYKNIIDWTVTHNNTSSPSNSLETVRAVFKNMGIPLPQGSCNDVLEILKTNNYMGWHSCSIKEAQGYANEGTAAIGISEERIVVLSSEVPDENVVSGETQVATPAVMTISDNTSAYAVSDLQYFAYSSGGTNNGIVINAYFEKKRLNVRAGWSGYNHLYGTRPTTVYWSSDNTDVASVSPSGGKVTAKTEGTAKISVYTRGGTFIASYIINVTGKRVKIKNQIDYYTVTFLDTPDPIIPSLDLMWKSIGYDLDEGSNNGYTIPKGAWDRWNFNKVREYSIDQLAYLYLFDPLGIRYYVKSNKKDVPDSLFFKDKLYKKIFGKEPRYFTINNNDEISYHHPPSADKRESVLSEAEILFGTHNIQESLEETVWRLFTNLVVDIFINAPGISDFISVVEFCNAMFFSGSITELFSSAPSTFLQSYINTDTLGGGLFNWALGTMNSFIPDLVDTFVPPNTNDIYIYKKVNENYFNTYFVISESDVSIEDIISRT